MVDVTRLAFVALLPWLKRKGRQGKKQQPQQRRSIYHFQIIGVDILVRDAGPECRDLQQRYSAHLLELNCNPSLTATDDEGNPSLLDGAVKGRVTAAALALAAATTRFCSAIDDGSGDGSNGGISRDGAAASGAAAGASASASAVAHDEERAAIASAFYLDILFPWGGSSSATAAPKAHPAAAPAVMPRVLLEATGMLEWAVEAFERTAPLGLDGPRAASKEVLGAKGTQEAMEQVLQKYSELARLLAESREIQESAEGLAGWSKEGEGASEEKGGGDGDEDAPGVSGNSPPCTRRKIKYPLSCEGFCSAVADSVGMSGHRLGHHQPFRQPEPSCIIARLV